jgi:hypothetical protein
MGGLNRIGSEVLPVKLVNDTNVPYPIVRSHRKDIRSGAGPAPYVIRLNLGVGQATAREQGTGG